MMVFTYFRLYQLQQGRCFYCGGSITQKPFVPKSRSKREGLPTPNLSGCTRDHFLPRVRGFNTVANVVLACEQCNRKKGQNIPTRDVCLRFDELMRHFTQFGGGESLPVYWQEFRETQAVIEWFKKVFMPVDTPIWL